MEQWIERGSNVIMHTYNRIPLTLSKGEGMYVWDTEGRKYLDFVSGIAVNSLGHTHGAMVEQMKMQLDQLVHCSNLYWNKPQIELGELLVQNSCFDKVFFCNSGTEAIEAALKLSRKYGNKQHGEECYEIITMKNSFHGRTFGSITATGQEKYQKGLGPLLPGILYGTYNDFESVKELVSTKTCAIFVEPIQGEGGILPADQKFLQQLRELCTQKDILLVFDEVQCGIGRCGELFAHEHFAVEPDVIALAKGLGGGVPIGAMMAVQKAAEAFGPGDHAATFGGNPLSCAAGKAVLTELLDEKLIDNVRIQGQYLQDGLKKLQGSFDTIIDIRGVGLMQGIELSIPVGAIIQKCMAKGLLVINAGTHVIRFVPPLIATAQDIDIALHILGTVLEEEIE